MGIKQAVWRIGAKPTALPDSELLSEQLLEDMIVAEPSILSDDWMLIGRQEITAHGGRIDLLAIAPDGALVLVELKRDKTPREVVAQAIDYASWVEGLDAIELAAIFGRYKPGIDFRTAFRARFGTELDEASLNDTHQIVVVSASLDDSSERIVRYLNDRGVAINVLSFQVFEDSSGQLLSRAWLLDPVTAQVTAAARTAGPTEPWNGEFYASFGAGASRSWDEAVAHGFISAGGGTWYSKTLNLLSPGDRVWVRVPQAGYVGVGRVIGEAQPATEFALETPTGLRPAAEVLTGAEYHRPEGAVNPELAEYFVRIDWLETRPITQAVNEIGLFGNQNTVCRPVTTKWRHTVDRLKRAFPAFDEPWDAGGQWSQEDVSSQVHGIAEQLTGASPSA